MIVTLNINAIILVPGMTIIRKVDQLNPDPSIVDEAAEIIRSGGTVVFPTETVYGLGADATNGAACTKIYNAKGRPPDNPLIIHFASVEMARNYAEIRPRIRRAADTLWPGPITFIVKSRPNISPVARASLGTVGVRIPANPLALQLIKKAKRPIAAPSANISTRPSIVTSEDAIRELSGIVDVILDAGETFFGIESTVVQLVNDGFNVLRPGALSVEDLVPILGKAHLDSRRGENDPPITPGMKYLHYAPRKKLFRIEDRSKLIEYATNNMPEDQVLICSDEVAQEVGREAISLGSENDIYEIARNLFRSFRKLDDSTYSTGLIQCFEEKKIGLAIMNRIRKASFLLPTGIRA